VNLWLYLTPGGGSSRPPGRRAGHHGPEWSAICRPRVPGRHLRNMPAGRVLLQGRREHGPGLDSANRL